MTEQDLDRLFSKSKEKPKQKLKTEIVVLDETRPRSPISKDFTAIKFLQLDDEHDRMLTGLPLPPSKENLCAGEEGDLTAKFKREYVVGKVIGEGAYASVRVAIFRPENRRIAIKAYEKVKIRDPQRKRTVRREIRILQAVAHPNIVRIFDVV
jgi:serine/threonine protein kinase